MCQERVQDRRGRVREHQVAIVETDAGVKTVVVEGPDRDRDLVMASCSIGVFEKVVARPIFDWRITRRQ